MANAFFINPRPKLPDIGGALEKGFRLKGAADESAMQRMKIEEAERANQGRQAVENAFTKYGPQFTKDGQTDYNAMGNAVSGELMGQGKSTMAIQVKEALSKLGDAEKKRIKDAMEPVQPIAFKAYSMFEDLLQKHQDPAKAQQEMDSVYWPQLRQAAIKAGAKPEDLSESYNQGETLQFLTVDTILKDELYNVRKSQATSKKSVGRGDTAFMKNVRFIREAHNATNPDNKITEFQAIEIMKTAARKPDEELNKWLLDNFYVSNKLPDDQKVAELARMRDIIRGTSEKKGAAIELNPLDRATASQILKEAGGDKKKAREMAKQRGYKL